MRTFTFTIALLTVLSPVLGLATNYLPRSPLAAPAPAPGIFDDIKNFIDNMVDSLSDTGKKVWSKLDDAEKKVLDRKSLETDGCKVVRCGVDLGVTSATCLAAVLGRKGPGSTANNLGCLAAVIYNQDP